MSRLFIELYLDEDVHVLIADLIKARGFQALTTRNANQLQNSDPEQLDYAINHLYSDPISLYINSAIALTL